jgi:TPR repeat protein
VDVKHLAAALLLLIGSASIAWAGFEEGRRAYLSGNYGLAIHEWLPLAEQGDAFAQYSLGYMYQQGEGVTQNYEWAAHWYRLAAEQGFAEAQNALGLMYGRGQGTLQNFVEAARWQRKAAEQGNAEAQYGLGVMYGAGLGVPQDYVLSHMWLNLAAAQGHKKAAEMRKHAEAYLTPAQIAEAQEMARNWRPSQ